MLILYTFSFNYSLKGRLNLPKASERLQHAKDYGNRVLLLQAFKALSEEARRLVRAMTVRKKSGKI